VGHRKRLSACLSLGTLPLSEGASKVFKEIISNQANAFYETKRASLHCKERLFFMQRNAFFKWKRAFLSFCLIAYYKRINEDFICK